MDVALNTTAPHFSTKFMEHGGSMSSRFDSHSKIKLGEYFRSHREKMKMSQEDVAHFLELKGSQYVSNVERGLAFFSTEQLAKIIDLYNLDLKIVQDIVSKELLYSFLREWNEALDQKKNRIEKLGTNKECKKNQQQETL